MFREMRRGRQQLSQEETFEILKNGTTAVLALQGDVGNFSDAAYTYAVPLNYVYADGKIYFHCAKEGHKIDALKNCSKISLCVVAKDDVIKEEMTTAYQSVIVFGTARILQNDDEIFHAAEVLGLRYYDNKDAVRAEIKREWSGLCCVEITIDHITGKQGRYLMRA